MGQWDAVVTALIGGASEPAALHHRIAGAAAGCGNLRHRAARARRVDGVEVRRGTCKKGKPSAACSRHDVKEQEWPHKTHFSPGARRDAARRSIDATLLDNITSTIDWGLLAWFSHRIASWVES